ncbi:MAG: hypothetical protein Q7R40_16050 [Phaeospirillum sp.]|nr:hypothetical protein [Phaeospirillum sp.]
MSITSTLTRLFSDPWERSISERSRQEPRLSTVAPGQDVTTAGQSAPLPALPAPAGQPEAPYDMRAISPRDFADATHELYMDGTLSWEEFKMVGFPSELDPRFDETIGALIGEKANPDQPKDMLGQWEQRVDFEKRYNPYPDQVKTAESVLQKLTCLSEPPLRLSA